MAAEGRLGRPSPVVGVMLLNLHHGVKPGRAPRRDVHVAAITHLAHRGVDGRFPRQAHEQLVLQPARQQRLVDRLPPVGDAVDLDHRLLPHDVVGLRQINERPLGHGSMGDAPFEDELGGRRYPQRHCAALHDGCRGQGLGDGQLVHVRRRGHGRGQQHVRRQSDADGNRQVVLHLAQRSVRASPLHQACCQSTLIQPQQPVERNVRAGVRILDEGHGSGGVRPRIVRPVGEEGQRSQIHLWLDHLLARGNIHQRRRLPIGQRLRQAEEQLLRLAAQRQGEVGPTSADSSGDAVC